MVGYDVIWISPAPFWSFLVHSSWGVNWWTMQRGTSVRPVALRACHGAMVSACIKYIPWAGERGAFVLRNKPTAVLR